MKKLIVIRVSFEDLLTIKYALITFRGRMQYLRCCRLIRRFNKIMKNF